MFGRFVAFPSIRLLVSAVDAFMIENVQRITRALMMIIAFLLSAYKLFVIRLIIGFIRLHLGRHRNNPKSITQKLLLVTSWLMSSSPSSSSTAISECNEFFMRFFPSENYRFVIFIFDLSPERFSRRFSSQSIRG